MFLRKPFKSILILATLFLVGIFFAQPIFAAKAPVEFSGLSTFASDAGLQTASTVPQIIANIIRFALTFLGIVAVVIVLYGGVVYMTAAGNPEKTKKARKIIVNGMIGIIIMLSSYAVTQFILGKFMGDVLGTQSSISGTGGSGGVSGSSGNQAFTLASPTAIIQCASKIRNVNVELVFSEAVKDEKGITLKKENGLDANGKVILVDAPGSFTVSGQKVTFVPASACPDPNGGLKCLDLQTTYQVNVDPVIVKSVTGNSLSCAALGGVNPCAYKFTTGTLVDAQPPSKVAMFDPVMAYLGITKSFSAETIDDSGVKSVDFYLDDATKPLFTSSGAEYSFAQNGSIFFSTFKNGAATGTQWNTTGYMTNKSYSVWATGNDCAGNSKTSSKFSVVLKAQNCDNGVIDSVAPYGETGLNCGGDKTSPYYCGACVPSACKTNAECSSGFCVIPAEKQEGVCKDVPVITGVSDNNGAPGNLVTISGYGFGTATGSVDFLGTEKNNTTKNAVAYACPGEGTKWSEKEIIVQIPVGAIDGPIRVNIPASGATLAQSDRTDDAFGPIMQKFDVNKIKRPGLCSLTPVASEVNKQVLLKGISFGDGGQTNTPPVSAVVKFTNFEALLSLWKDTEIAVTVPNVPSGTYYPQVFTGNTVCIDASGQKTNVSCNKNEDCAANTTCGLAWCSETLKYCSSDEACNQKTAKPCIANSDCAVIDAEFCDLASKVCVKSEGICTDVRVGSNPKSFTAVNDPSAVKPVINSIDPISKKCAYPGVQNADPFPNGVSKLCVVNADCPKVGTTDGVCKEYPNTAGPGQYITIYGAGFGTSPGNVKFQKGTSFANADTSFPDGCGKQYWFDDHIIIKVPKKYSNNTDDLTNSDYQLIVTKQGGALTSSPVNFHVYPAVLPGPSVCSMQPSAGPIGTEITLNGVNFGNQKKTVQFFSGLDVQPDNWTDSTIKIGGGLLNGTKSFGVPAGAKTGPVSVFDSSNNKSNSFNFKVGNCNKDFACGVGEECCSDGACVNPKIKACASGPKPAHFAYKISTNPVPVAPKVVINCFDKSISSPSPSPSPMWSDQKNVCVDAAVTASFDIPMVASSLVANNIVVQKCETETNAVCTRWETNAIAGTFTPSEKSFQWKPQNGTFETNKLYQVTIKGASANGVGVKSEKTATAGEAFMEKDFVWQFRTSESNEKCGIGTVTVSPKTFTATEPGKVVDYLASLVSKNDSCVVVACTDKYNIGWNSDQWNATFFPNEGNGLAKNPAPGACFAGVQPNWDTQVNNPVSITAVVDSEQNKPSGFGLLTINSTEPKIIGRFPDCQSACPNVKPYVAFNVSMSEYILASAQIHLYKCNDPSCSWPNFSDVTNSVLMPSPSTIQYDKVTKRAHFNFQPNVKLDLNTSYRITLGPNGYFSDYLKNLFPDGSNYQKDATDTSNLFFPNQYSWTFRTKALDAGCGVDHVVIEPKESVLKFVGEHQEYSAIAHGVPDECSNVTGQSLQDESLDWNAWTVSDEPPPAGKVTTSTTDVALMLKRGSQTDGEIKFTKKLPAYCSSNCLLTGSKSAICGNGKVEQSEVCDDKNLVNGDGCSSVCLLEGTKAPLCGNGMVDTFEECDDGGNKDKDGCSSICLKEGSTLKGVVCGNNVVNEDVQTKAGESCDDGNVVAGDGCSKECLKEGSMGSILASVCGNGIVEVGEQCEIGTAGCSLSCLKKGTFLGTGAGMCGNGVQDVGEDIGCDLGGGNIAKWCKPTCLYAGSSAKYAEPSFCGDGEIGKGEQCDASAQDVSAAKTQGYAVAEIRASAPSEVETDPKSPNYGFAISKVKASVVGQPKPPAESKLSLQCSCDTDAICGLKTGTTQSLGCGVAKCCYERPDILSVIPDGTKPNLCRNTAVSVAFSQAMDVNSFASVDANGDKFISASEYDPNVQLELVKIGGKAVTFGVALATDCPYYPKQVDGTKFITRIWNWIKSRFNQSAFANAMTQCFVPVTYEYDTKTNQVYLRYKKMLEANAEYKITVKTDPNGKDANVVGVKGQNGVSVCLSDNSGVCATTNKSVTFTTGSDVCLFSIASVTDTGITPPPPVFASKSPGYFSKTNEVHAFSVKALTVKKDTGAMEEISPVSGVYDWMWEWGTNVKDVAKNEDILSIVQASTSKDAAYKALTKNGTGNVIATATIGTDTINNSSKSEISGSVPEVAFLCENPWPALNDKNKKGEVYGIPYIDVKDDTDPAAIHANFSMFYCRDQGKNTPLKALTLPPTISTPASSNINSEILKEFVFNIAGTSDSVGVRVLENPNYLTPAEWYESQGFSGTPQPMQVDGYEAVKNGTTAYVAATNKVGAKVYSNIYVISYNGNATAESQQIIDLLLSNFHLNANTDEVSSVGLCKKQNAYEQYENTFVACSADQDCLDLCTTEGKCSVSKNKECKVDADCTYAADACDADKQKLTRDLKRLQDVNEMVDVIEKYGKQNKHCSVSKNKTCNVDKDCGTEKCVNGYPTVLSGTYIPSMTNSTWSSWNSTLSNALASALPTDPLNTFFAQCKKVGEPGYDAGTCWNVTKGKFVCPEGSYVYGYQNKGGEDVTLSTTLEYKSVLWAHAIDKDVNDHTTVQASYKTNQTPAGGLPDGFIVASNYCNATVFGNTAICGDGIKSSGEDCEKGEVKAISCVMNVCVKGDKDKIGKACETVSVVKDCGTGGVCTQNVSGLINTTCKSDCTFQKIDEAKTAGAQCKAPLCGNGIIDKNTTEICDDGALNGTYGHCGLNCNLSDNVKFCGDGMLSGAEQCDCASEQYAAVKNQSTIASFKIAFSKSWTAVSGKCDAFNGQYAKSGNNCTSDCKAPGPMCGDKIKDALEVCDGGTETYAGALCTDGETKCTKDADCAQGTKCGVTNYAACTKETICVKGDLDKIGQVCAVDGACGTNGDCSTEKYQLARTRTCAEPKDQTGNANTNACTWVKAANNGWGVCEGGPQNCGNGTKEGTEECDDGNSLNNDACTNVCKNNVCGDQFVYVGVESCDAGAKNGQTCTANYGSTCNYCNKYCQYKTQSGEYCGDGQINGTEYCDGASVPKTCVKLDVDGKTVLQKLGTCKVAADCNTNGQTGYVCALLGAWNGGAKNGQMCDAGSSTANPTTGGNCIPPVCADNCSGSCPVSYKTLSVQAQSNVQNASSSNGVNLYAQNNKTSQTPDKAAINLPACSVSQSLRANVSGQNTTLPNLDVVFITALADNADMALNGYPPIKGEKTQMDIITDALTKAINNLKETYKQNAGKAKLRIGMYGSLYQKKDINSYWTGDLFDMNIPVNVTKIQNLIQKYKEDQGSFQGISNYVDESYDKVANVWLSDPETEGNKKIVVFISSANPVCGGIEVTNSSTKYKFNDIEFVTDIIKNSSGGVFGYQHNECPAMIRDTSILPNKDKIDFYSVAIGKWYWIPSFMQHMSSETCKDKVMGSLKSNDKDCTSGNYAFTTDASQGIGDVYKKIMDDVLKKNVVVTAKDLAGNIITTTKGVEIGDQVNIPLPNTFACQNKPFNVTLEAKGYSGTLDFSNFNFHYCPAP